MNSKLTKKDFMHYIAKGGNFNKVIYLNKQQLKKLDKDQLAGRKAVFIDGKEGYVGGDNSWTPKKLK